MEDWISTQLSGELAAMRTELAADALAIEAAAYARVALAERFAASTGVQVRLATTAHGAEQPVGRLSEVLGGALVVEAPGASWLVPLSAVVWASGLVAGNRPLGNVEERLGLGHLLRGRIGSPVVVASGPHRWAGRLVRVGADHVELGDPPAVLALAQIGWVRARPPA